MFILLFLLFIQSSSQHLYPLSYFGTSREIRGRYLFPSRSITIPSYFDVPSNDPYTISYIHIHHNDIDNAISDVSSKSLLVKSICSYEYKGETFYVMNIGNGEGRHEIALNLSMAQLQETMKDHTEKKIEVSFICSNEWNSFDVVWHHNKNFVNHFIVEESTLKDALENGNEKAHEGYYPSLIQSFNEEGNKHALIIWRKGFGIKYRVVVSSDNDNFLNDSSLHLSSISSIDDVYHISIYKDNGFTWRNRTIIKSTKEGQIDMSVLDWEVESEMRSQEIPSISLSILYDDRILFERAYGYADILNNTMATVHHRYRIASVSKTITAMIITDLVNQGKISYGDRVFGPNGILSSYYKGPTNLFLRSITIQHLLEHSSGAWSHLMKLEFTKMELSRDQFLQWILSNHQPRIPPGQVHVYSNIGYLFLGRVIEKITGMSYEDYTNRSLFHLLGIEGAKIANRKPLRDEVTYYSHDNASPYLSWNSIRMDSAAGWTLRPNDVSRIMAELNKNRLTKYRLMVVRGWTRWNYGRGIQISSDGSIYHIGSMAGSECIAYAKGRLSISIVANLRGTQENWLTPWMENVSRRISQRFV